jgi:hypothetical protein
MRTGWWPAFVAAGATLAAILLAYRLARYGCDGVLLRGASSGSVVFSCAEFWLNRYQSLIGNVITAAVAALTLWALLGQLNINSRQAAVTSAQSLRMRIGELEKEREALTNERLTLRSSALKIGMDENNQRALPDDISRAKRTSDDITIALGEWNDICIAAIIIIPPEEREKNYKDIIDLIGKADDLLDTLRSNIDRYQLHLDNEDDLIASGEAAAQVVHEIGRIGGQINRQIQIEYEKTWRTIRAFENAAVK